MTMQSITTLDAGVLPPDLKAALKELQGLNVTLVAGAAANTKMNIAALRTEDTILRVLTSNDAAAGALVDDTANVTVQDTHATGTLTISGNPVNGETFVVNDITYTWKTTPIAITDVKITAGDNTAMAAAVASVINTNETKRLAAGREGASTPAVVATAALGVVTITSVADGAGNGPVVSKTGAPITLSSAAPEAVTATFVSAVNGNDITVNGVTFSIKTTPVNLELDMGVKASDILQAAEVARIVNAYEGKYGTLDVVASVVGTNVVTFRPNSAKKGNIISLTEAATNVAVSGSGYLAGGTATGGIKSTTNNTSRSVIVYWFNKQ